jgi:hypothetical protein
MRHYLKTHPDAGIKDGIVWARARRMLKEGRQALHVENDYEPAEDIPFSLRPPGLSAHQKVVPPPCARLVGL